MRSSAIEKEVVMGFLATIFEKLGFRPSAAWAAPQ